MATYEIWNSKAKKWGVLTSHQALSWHTAPALGAGLDIAVLGLELVENQLLAGLALACPDHVRKALYLYFGVPLVGSKDALDDTLGKIINVIRTTRQGLAGEFGTLDIRQNESGTSVSLNGYVKLSWGSMGPIHINFPKIMSLAQDLGFGGAYWSGLIVHEATHRYARTTDLIGEVKQPGKDPTDGYLAGSRRGNTLVEFDNLVTGGLSSSAARARLVTDRMDNMTTEQALINADSYTWLFISMLQAYATALPVAKKFSGIYLEFQQAAARFEKVQRESLAADPALSALAGALQIVYYAPT